MATPLPPSSATRRPARYQDLISRREMTAAMRKVWKASRREAWEDEGRPQGERLSLAHPQTPPQRRHPHHTRTPPQLRTPPHATTPPLPRPVLRPVVTPQPRTPPREVAYTKPQAKAQVTSTENDDVMDNEHIEDKIMRLSRGNKIPHYRPDSGVRSDRSPAHPARPGSGRSPSHRAPRPRSSLTIGGPRAAPLTRPRTTAAITATMRRNMEGMTSLPLEVAQEVIKENLPSRPPYTYPVSPTPRRQDTLTQTRESAHPHFHNTQTRTPRYFFLHPGWDSERLTLQRLLRQGKHDWLKYGWM